MEKVTHSLEEFTAVAEAFVKSLAKNPAGATLITLSGDLGAGKTALVKVVARTLGVEGDITSPTFVLMKSYELPAGPWKRLIHIDAYRLEGGTELAPLHFDEVVQQADNLVMLEWPEKVHDTLPRASVHISIETLAEGARKITYA